MKEDIEYIMLSAQQSKINLHILISDNFIRTVDLLTCMNKFNSSFKATL